MVFIQLIRFQLEMTLKFLSLVPGPTGKAALDYILTEWCARQNEFFGAYERKTRYCIMDCNQKISGFILLDVLLGHVAIFCSKRLK